jgi:DNA-binding transcriptional regulator YiaG
MIIKDDLICDENRPVTLCPECGSQDVETLQETESFDHGGRETPIRVTATLPIKHCRKCKFAFEDGETEMARHEAACAQLGVLTPKQIRSIRETAGLSREEFARQARLDVVALGHWEYGHVIQNSAYDDYLYLLSFADNLQRLRQRRKT